MCTKEHKETYFEIIMSISFASLKHLKLPISISEYCLYMANCLYLHDSYTTKFDFTNYAFA